MKYIKLFEAVRSQPKIGDYVYCEIDPEDSGGDHRFTKYVEDNIGQIVKRTISEELTNKKGSFLYQVQYKGITKNDYETTYMLVSNTEDVFNFWRREIKYWSNNKDELEYLVVAKKYNL